ncbi:MAG: dihydrofolate reductase [Bacteroidetes bacterium]|nr:dihydrofolate reductase [Bacteroidota bacterium]
MTDHAKRPVVVFIAMSLDGYIADADGSIGWLSQVERAGEDYGYHDFIATVDTVIMGRKTYEIVLGFGIPFPHADKRCFILTRTPRAPEGSITFTAGPVDTLIAQLRSEAGGTIFVDGGAEVIQSLQQCGGVDEYIISIIPVLLGGGTRLFTGPFAQQPLENLGARRFDSGLVQLRYRVLHNERGNSQ